MRAGADKVSINTAAIKKPQFVSKASNVFGSSTIVIAIEAIKHSENSYLAYTDNGREFTGIDAVLWAKEVEQLGAGEILLTSIDKEGTGEGFDLELIKLVTDSVNIPVIAHGGAANQEHIYEAIKSSFADAISISSMIHYSALRSNKDFFNLNNEEGNTEFLNQKKSFKMFGNENIIKIKNNLIENNIPQRILS